MNFQIIHPLALGVMLVVAVGTLAYTLWNSRERPQTHHNYQRYSPPPESVYSYSQSNADSSSDDGSESNKGKRRKVNEVCSICLQVKKINLTTLSCSHSFHSRCIQTWFNSSKTCPVCRNAEDR